MPAQKPASRTMPAVCSSTWSMTTRAGSTLAFLSESMMSFVPLSLSSRWGVWMRMGRSYFFAISTCSSKMASSLLVFLLRPISPMPRTFGLSRNSGMIWRTSRANPASSDSFGLMQSQQ